MLPPRKCFEIVDFFLRPDFRLDAEQTGKAAVMNGPYGAPKKLYGSRRTYMRPDSMRDDQGARVLWEDP